MERSPSKRLAQSSKQSSSAEMFKQFTSIINTGIEQGVKIAGTGLNTAGQALYAAQDALGVRDQFEGAEIAVGRVVARGQRDANRALRRAEKLAIKALEFDDDEENYDTIEFDRLLAAGAVKFHVLSYNQSKNTITVPPNSAVVWKARVRSHDISFSVIEESLEASGYFEHQPLQRYHSDQSIQGSIAARKVVACWVNHGEGVSLNDLRDDTAKSKEALAAEEGPSDFGM